MTYKMQAPQAVAWGAWEVAGAEGLELSTSGFGDRRSSQLSYAPSPNQRKAAFHTLWGALSSMVRCLTGAGDGNRTRTTSLEG